MLYLCLLALALSVHALNSDAYTIDACRDVKCLNKDEVPCLEILSHALISYECRCAKECRTIKYIKSPIVRTLPPVSFDNQPVFVTDGNVTRTAIPIAKQGGSACYPSACMNGGVCYSNFNPTAPIATTTTVASAFNVPLCSCQSQFSGSRCELYNPTTPTPGWNNLCRVYTDRNMNICQNGGQCVFISDGKVACVCPSSFVGQYCEQPVYVQCQSPVSASCHRDYGVCATDGSCRCNAGYMGPKCDQRSQLQQNLIPNSCTNYCENGGTCLSNNGLVCLCPATYTGLRCEQLVQAPTGVVQQNRCNLTITLTNDGAYVARFRVYHTINGIRQAEIISDRIGLIGSKTSITVPYYATDIQVLLERLGFVFTPIWRDSGITTDKSCTKCFKVWGSVTDPSWDYLEC